MQVAPAQSLEQLLSVHDEDFVRTLYATILRRKPDPDGFRDALTHLRSGVPREQLIATFVLSPEGSRSAPALPGLDALVHKHRPRRPGLFARAMARLGACLMPALDARLRSLENRLYVVQQAADQASTAARDAADAARAGPSRSAPAVSAEVAPGDTVRRLQEALDAQRAEVGRLRRTVEALDALLQQRSELSDEALERCALAALRRHAVLSAQGAARDDRIASLVPADGADGARVGRLN